MRLLTGADFWALYDEPAVGLRRMVTSDGPAGVRGELWDERDPSTNIPSPTAIAASWDPELTATLGRLLAHEARRKGVDVVLAPDRQPAPLAVRRPALRVLQRGPGAHRRRSAPPWSRGCSPQGVAATVKHFVANDSETDRLTVDARVDERTLRELYLAPFETIVRDAGAWSVMAAYNSVNGHSMTESPMLRAILHEEWGFDGVTMTDWYAGRSTEPAARGGLDLIMPGPTGPWREALVTAVREGRVDEADVDAKVVRLLRLAARVGALADGPAPLPVTPWTDEESDALVQRAAAAGFVLVRNAPVGDAPVLPVDPARCAGSP